MCNCFFKDIRMNITQLFVKYYCINIITMFKDFLLYKGI